MKLKSFAFPDVMWRKSDAGEKPLYIILKYFEVEGMTDLGTLRYSFYAGATTDGLSVPWAFRWFLKTWDEKNIAYNLAGLCHDAGYASKGWGFMSRSNVDDVFRGMLREAGMNRLHASMADFCVGAFAKSHWGSDEYSLQDYCHCTLIKGKNG